MVDERPFCYTLFSIAISDDIIMRYHFKSLIWYDADSIV